MTSSTQTALPQDSNGPWVVVTTWAVTGLATFFVALRYYCRIFRSRSFALDDQVMLGAWVLLVAQTALGTYNVHLGMGKHIYNMDPANITELLMMSDIATVPAVMAVALSKASAGISLLRLLEKRWLRLVVQMVIFTTVLAMIGVSVLTFVQCDPVSKHWNFQTPGVCWPPDFVPKFAIAAAIYSGVSDILLSLIPWPIIMSLKMNKREKLGIALALASILFAGISSFVKATTLLTLRSTDPTFDIARLIVFGTIEISVTIIAACIPVLRVLLRDVQRTYLTGGSGGRTMKTDRNRGRNPYSTARSSMFGTPYSNARSSIFVTQLRKRPEDFELATPGPKPVVVQEKSWTITYSPATGSAPMLQYATATTLPQAAGSRRSMVSPRSPQSFTSLRSAEDPVSPISTPTFPPRTPQQAWRHTIDWRVHLDLSPSTVTFDDDVARGRPREVEMVDNFV